MEIFNQLYRYYKKHRLYNNYTTQEVVALFLEKHDVHTKLEEHNINIFNTKIEGVKVTIDDSSAFFPICSVKDFPESKMKGTRKILSEVELLLSPGIIVGHIYDLSEKLKKTDKELRYSEASSFLADIFNVKNIAFFYFEIRYSLLCI